MPILIPLPSSQTLTVSDTAVGLTLPDRTNAALITVDNTSIRWWDSGDTPTASVGHLAPAGTQIQYFNSTDRDLLFNFKAIRATLADAVIQVTYYVYRNL